MSFHDRLVCIADFVGLTFVAVLFLRPIPNCFLGVFFPHSLQPSGNFFHHQSINNLGEFWQSKIQQNSTHEFCRWNVIFTQKWQPGSLKNLGKCTESSSLVHVFDHYLYWIESPLLLKQSSFHVFYVRNECWRIFWTSKQDEWFWQIKRVFFNAHFSHVNVNKMIKIFEQRSEL